MAKFVRWLGAFGKGKSLMSSAQWELSQTERQVAAEPLYRGNSSINHPRIGLVFDEKNSRFHAGWLSDAWTEVLGDGTLRPKCGPSKRSGKKFRDADRLLAALHRADRTPYQGHAEAVFDSHVFRAVACKRDAIDSAKKLAECLNLPLEVIA